MLTIEDIPDKYRKGETDGENIARLASGVQTAIRDAVGDDGLKALNRFVQAGLLFRSSEIGRVMIGDYTTLGGSLRETSQVVNFAGGALSASTLVGAVDLTAAAMRRLYLGPVNNPDDGREADLMSFPGEAHLPEEPKAWLQSTRDSHGWEVLKGVRDGFVHRWFRMDVTIHIGGAGELHHLEIAGQSRPLGEFLNECRDFVFDRLVAAGLLIDEYAHERLAKGGLNPPP